MFRRKSCVIAIFGLIMVFLWNGAPAVAQNTWSFGAGLGTLTYSASTGQNECWIEWSEYYSVPYYYEVIYYNSFKYNPDPSTGLPSVPISGGFAYIESSMGPGYGLSDSCPANTPLSGNTPITYTDTSSHDGGLAGYTITLSDPYGNFSAGISLGGYINPKWEVVGILYAPPGARNSGNNNVNYTKSTLVSVTNSIDKTWSKETTVATTFSETAGLALPGVAGGKITYKQGTSNSYTQGTEDGTSTTVSKTTSLGLTVKAGNSGYAGLDHDWDVLEVWTNPVTLVTLGDGGVDTWSGYGFNSNDSRAPGDMEIALVNLGCLNGHWSVTSFPSGLGPSNLGQLIQQYCGNQTWGFYDQKGNWNNGPFLRSWASSQHFDNPDAAPASPPPGYSNASLAPADFQTIGQMDLWYACTNESPQPSTGEDWTTVCPSPNPADNGSDPAGVTEPNLQALEAEFTPVPTNGGVPYAQGENFTGTIEYQDMDSESTTTGQTTTRSFGWEVGMEYSSGGKFFIFSGGITASVTKSGKETTTLKSNTEIKTSTTSTVSATLGPPPNLGVDGCPSNVAYPPGIAYTNYPDQTPDCGVPIPGDKAAYGQKTLFNVYEDNYFGSFLFSPVYY